MDSGWACPPPRICAAPSPEDASVPERTNPLADLIWTTGKGWLSCNHILGRVGALCGGTGPAANRGLVELRITRMRTEHAKIRRKGDKKHLATARNSFYAYIQTIFKDRILDRNLGTEPSRNAKPATASQKTRERLLKTF